MFTKSVINVVRAVELVEAMQFFRFTAISDDKTCEQCNKYDGSLMTRRECERTFPDLEKISDLLWYPHVHPNCRCILTLEEEQE